jgi:hypothetical protein
MDFLPGLVVLAAIGLGGLWLRHHLGTYLSEKGKNLATKEDVGALTHAVESVKLQYQRAGVVQKAQFEAELHTYEEIWEKLIDVQRSAMELRPALDRGLAPGETKEQRKSQRLQRFADAFNEFTRTVRKRRPFYPEEVFKELNELVRLAHSEAVDYQLGEPGVDPGYWKQAMDNAQKISAQVDNLCNVIRERLAKVSAA